MRKVLHLMGALTDGDVEWLITHGRTRFVPPDSFVIHEGEPIGSLFILLEGKLSVRLGAGAAGREVAVLHPGEVLGEISFVDARLPSASVISVEPSHVFEMKKDVLAEKMGRDDALAAHFYRGLALFLAERLRVTTSHLGYGKWEEAQDADEIDETRLDDISMAARRFDDMLRRLRLAT